MIRKFKRSKGDPRWIGPFLELKKTAQGVVVKTADGDEMSLTLAGIIPFRTRSTLLGEDPVVSLGTSVY